MRKRDGEYIALHWEGDADAEYVRGHVDRATFAAALMDGCGVKLREDDRLLYLYGRWSCEWGPNEQCQTLRVYRFPGRGRFTITAAPIDDQPPYIHPEPPGFVLQEAAT